MSMPTTTDEFEAVLKAFKEQDANGNGDASDEIPFSTDPNNKHIEAMAGYFGLPMNKLGIAIQNEKAVSAIHTVSSFPGSTNCMQKDS
mgnify:FL=1